MIKAFYHGQEVTSVMEYDEDGWVLFRTDHAGIHIAELDRIEIVEVEE